MNDGMTLETKTFNIGGMTCSNCETRVTEALTKLSGVFDVNVSLRNEDARFNYDPSQITLKQIAAAITELGYEILPQKRGLKPSDAISILIIIAGLYFILQMTGVLNLLAPSSLAQSGMGYGMLFVTGVITSVHCIAMCGGINLSQCLPTNGTQENARAAFKPAFLYNLGRVVSYTLIGAIAGSVGLLLGNAFEFGLSMIFQGGIKIFAGVFMIVMGLGMSGLFAKLRLSLPKGLSAKLNTEKHRGHGAFVVGLLNGIMPCGPLQSMWLVALGTAHPVSGALAMLFFSLGTVPLVLGLGALVTALGRKFTRAVMLAGSILVIVLGLAMCAQGSALTGMIGDSALNVIVMAAAIAGCLLWIPAKSRAAKISTRVAALLCCVAGIITGVIAPQSIPSKSAENGAQMALQNGKQVIHSTLQSNQYPDIVVKAGAPVQWIIDAAPENINGCNNKLIIPEYGIEYTFHPGQNIIEFTPTKPGTIPYSCWMGMIKAHIDVQ